LQLIACAGSGKTEVVARRVVHLLKPDREDALKPGNIIAFTFTEKAAAELKERIVARTLQALGEINGLAEMFVGTIHAFCLELLKGEVPEEAAYIAETIRALRGVAFREGEQERGLSWSNMAILLRSVEANAEPITSALHAAGIPFVVTGMTNLFATAEAVVKGAWNAAHLGLDPDALRTAIEGAARDPFIPQRGSRQLAGGVLRRGRCPGISGPDGRGCPRCPGNNLLPENEFGILSWKFHGAPAGPWRGRRGRRSPTSPSSGPAASRCAPVEKEAEGLLEESTGGFPPVIFLANHGVRVHNCNDD
jgi:hypothetical protein